MVIDTNRTDAIDSNGKLVLPISYGNLEAFVGNKGKKKVDGSCQTACEAGSILGLLAQNVICYSIKK